MRKKVVVIGSGFSGLAAACVLAQQGCDVHVFEKNSMAGGRARTYTHQGFVFDMGPSWYWMPEIFDNFFNRFGKNTDNYYRLGRLNPSYKVIFKDSSSTDVPADITELKAEFEKLEFGSGAKLDEFLAEAKKKYEAGMHRFVWKPGHSWTEFLNLNLISEASQLDIFNNMRKHLRKYFSHPNILQLMEFPVLFLGAKPQNTPALYSMMNYADIVLGTWYPLGGMGAVPQAMESLANELGVRFHFQAEVTKIKADDGKVNRVEINGRDEVDCDAIISAADYFHTELNLLDQKFRNYNEAYWNKRVMSPSSLIFYVGIDKPIRHLQHHNLFFDGDFERHAAEIYDQPAWPACPLFYLCVPSKSDNNVAPYGKENFFILIPVAAGMQSEEEHRQTYFEHCLSRIEKHTGESIKEHVLFAKSYAHEEFERDYHSYKGNAYGLANTLGQTAFMKPKMRNRKLKNLFYSGQLTVPGPGVPPAIISGQLAAEEVLNYFNNHN
ncbi:MAG: phytoene desaturase family protein [Flavobacteriales bacterium]